MRFRLRTLLIVLALGPMVLAAGWRFIASSDQPRMNVVRGLPPGAFLPPKPRRATSQLGHDDESQLLGIEIPPP